MTTSPRWERNISADVDVPKLTPFTVAVTVASRNTNVPLKMNFSPFDDSLAVLVGSLTVSHGGPGGRDRNRELGAPAGGARGHGDGSRGSGAGQAPVHRHRGVPAC
jgi:hypothetical protein